MGLSPKLLSETFYAFNGLTVSYTDQITVTIARDSSGAFHPLDLFFGSGASGQISSDALFGNTSMLAMKLPEGVTYTSTSGTFLSNPAYTGTPVPEPTTMLLLGAGLASMTVIRRKTHIK